jgi:hypothetical protein
LDDGRRDRLEPRTRSAGSPEPVDEIGVFAVERLREDGSSAREHDDATADRNVDPLGAKEALRICDDATAAPDEREFPARRRHAFQVAGTQLRVAYLGPDTQVRLDGARGREGGGEAPDAPCSSAQ